MTKRFIKAGISIIVLLIWVMTAVGQTFASQDSLPSAQILRPNTCNGSLGEPVVNITFGSGPNFGAALAPGITTMQYVAGICPTDGQYSIVNQTSGCFGNTWHTTTDHTGDPEGYFMLINASFQPSDFYVQEVNGLCSGTTYRFAAFVLSLMNVPGINPDLSFTIERTDGTVLQTYNTGSIGNTAQPVFNEYGFYFTTPPGVSSVILRIRNNAPGGNGNDLGLDDISFKPAGPLTNIAVLGIPGDNILLCNRTATMQAVVEACYANTSHQWQVSINGGTTWSDIPGANNTSLNIPVLPQGIYMYRLLVAESGNINQPFCRVSSNVITVRVVPVDPIIQESSAIVCEGQQYILPWGASVGSSGLYSDTIRYVLGCDSLIRKVQLTVKPVININSNVTVCEGQSFTLPWGQQVNATGLYADTVRYVSGCDSLVQQFNIRVLVISRNNITASVCAGQSYILPSGTSVSNPGIYRDTVKTFLQNCDSLITVLTLDTSRKLTITITKSNDISCSLGTTRLSATGGTDYSWSPPAYLDNPLSANPLASPTATTLFRVRVTDDNGCTGKDSILVNVIKNPAGRIFSLPSAFSPNNDGMNDCFGGGFFGFVSDFKLAVYNRWGNQLFSTERASECWDGKYKGIEQAPGTYIYYVSANTICGKIYNRGTVILIR